jgi:hypothetical protein
VRTLARVAELVYAMDSKSIARKGMRVRIPPRALSTFCAAAVDDARRRRSNLSALRMGYTVDESAGRFANYFHVLRELAHLTAGHLALEPRFEVKALLGDHLHDDARATTKIQRRLHELGGATGAPDTELAALLDRASHAGTHAYLEIAYGELKPALIAALRRHLAELDPLLDEPSLRVVTHLLHRQERHTAELPAAGTPPFEDLGALPIRADATRALRVLPRLVRPSRDVFVEVADPPEPHRIHALMNAELCAAELTSRNSHEHPEMPWDFHADMARQTWDEIRHAEVYDRLMTTELGCHWGDHPVAFAHFDELYALDLAGRLARYEGPSTNAGVSDYLAADEAAHAENAARWRAFLSG